jgi:catechol 2,3-dioxygenase-like lactoylglutathione lyase family enzyme
MPRLDHAAFETDDPDSTAAFYERIFGARVVKAEGHPSGEQRNPRRPS